jgi:putative ABC transport system ATP-binding protein
VFGFIGVFWTFILIKGGPDKSTARKVFIDGESIYFYKEEKLAIFRRRAL